MSSRSKGKRKAVDPSPLSPSPSSPGSPSEPTERTALLPSSPSLSASPYPSSSRRHYLTYLYSALITFFSLLFAFLLLLALLLTSFRPSESESSTNALASSFAYSTVPDHISLLNLSDSGVVLNLTVRAGIDVDSALAVGRLSAADRSHAAEAGVRGGGAEWWERLRLWTARTLLNYLPTHKVKVEISDPILVSASHGPSDPLVRVSLLEPLLIPLVQNVPQLTFNTSGARSPSRRAPAWLEPVNVLVLVHPVTNFTDVTDFLKRAWDVGSANVVVDVHQVAAGVPGWSWAAGQRDHLSLDLNVAVPALPNLPRPGHPLNLSSLLQLDYYSFSTSDSSSTVPSPNSTTTEPSQNDGGSSVSPILRLIAHATVPNFVPSLAGASLPFRLPFSIALPADNVENNTVADNTTSSTTHSTRLVPIAHVATEPVVIGAGKNISLGVNGTIDAGIGQSSDALSLFLQRYLHGEPNPIIVRGGTLSPPAPAPTSTTPSVPSPPTTTSPSSFGDAAPPDWLLASLASLEVSLEFPAPYPRPKVVKSVSIENMRLAEAGGVIKMSGEVVAIVELPKEMASVQLNITAVRPDVLIFDGPAPGSENEATLGSHSHSQGRSTATMKTNIHGSAHVNGWPWGRPRPDKPQDTPGDGDDGDDGDDDEFPACAFGRINPPLPIAAITHPSPDPETSPHALLVRAPFVDIDLIVLPGRDSVLGDFIGKVVFRGGATAGIAGSADTVIEIRGVESELEIKGLPVQGEFWVGRNKKVSGGVGVVGAVSGMGSVVDGVEAAAIEALTAAGLYAISAA